MPVYTTVDPGGGGSGTTVVIPPSSGGATTSSGTTPVVTLPVTVSTTTVVVSNGITPPSTVSPRSSTNIPKLTAKAASPNSVDTSTGSNATLQLVTDLDSTTGNPIWTTYNIGITSLSTASVMQLSTAQTQNTMIYVPVRRSEQMIQFTIEWPLQTKASEVEGVYNYNGFSSMQDFHNAIRRHQQYAVNSYSPAPMIFNYTNNSDPLNKNSIIDNNLRGISGHKQGWKKDTLKPISFQGWILSVNKEYDRFKNVYNQQYIMNVLTPATGPDTYFSNLGDKGVFDKAGSTNDANASIGSVLQRSQEVDDSNILKMGLNWYGTVAEPTIGIDVGKIGN